MGHSLSLDGGRTSAHGLGYLLTYPAQRGFPREGVCQEPPPGGKEDDVSLLWVDPAYPRRKQSKEEVGESPSLRLWVRPLPAFSSFGN